MDIKPPSKRPLGPVAKPVPRIEPPKPLKSLPEHSLKISNLKIKRPRPLWQWMIVGMSALVVIIAVAVLSWYAWATQPLDRQSDQKIRISVESGDSPILIANNLKKHGIVRSSTAVRVYTEITGTKDKLQAGGYSFSPSQSVADIIDHLVKGKTDDFTLTIPPGITLKQLRSELKKYGYSDDEITQAYEATYDLPLFADKPANATIEGYIFPETFKVDPNSSLQELFKRSFTELYADLQQENLIEKFKSHGLNIYQGLTLASIVQKEVSDGSDQKQVAQVFYSRLAAGIPLGSDVTFMYAAELMGVAPSVGLDSPYNTRKYGGLPPGPIANMNLSALQAVADPAPGDYLYFVAGDGDYNGRIFYSRTDAEHQENVAKYCHDLCN